MTSPSVDTPLDSMGLPLDLLPGDRMVTVEKDELDIERLVVWQIRRGTR